jgi:hypothetical protein
MYLYLVPMMISTENKDPIGYMGSILGERKGLSGVGGEQKGPSLFVTSS